MTQLVCNIGEITIWDVGGQSGVRAIWDKYYSEANGIIYVIDAADRNRIEEAKTELKGVIGHPDLSDAPVLILANKQDIADALPPDALRNMLDLDEVGICRVAGVVALNGDGLMPSLQWLLDQLPGSKRTERLRHMRD